MPDQSASGSCARCGRALDLASVERDGLWYCRATCAAGEGERLRRVLTRPRRSVRRDARRPRGPVDPRARPAVDPALINKPRRHFRSRRPKELRRPRD